MRGSGVPGWGCDVGPGDLETFASGAELPKSQSSITGGPSIQPFPGA